MSPFFSIIIPTYNRALLLQQSIYSVLAQSFGDFEIVVIDDGSTDNTEEVVRAIGSLKMLYFKKSNGERGAARNFGIEKSSGRYLVFMDSDDQMMTNHLAVLHHHLADHPENFVATKYSVFNDKGSKVPKDIKKLSAGHHRFATFLIGNPLACCFTVRRENPDLIRFREELKYTIMEDWIFLMENLQHSSLYLIDQVTMSMRDHEERSMRGSAMRIIHARENAVLYLTELVRFSENDLKLLIGNSEYFCAVHAYIGRETKKAWKYLGRSVAKTGLSAKALLLSMRLSLQTVWGR